MQVVSGNFITTGLNLPTLPPDHGYEFDTLVVTSSHDSRKDTIPLDYNPFLPIALGPDENKFRVVKDSRDTDER